MVFETIIYSVEEDLASIILNRPEVSNGFNIPMCQEILAALEDAEKNEEVKFIILSDRRENLFSWWRLSEMKRAVDADDIESLVLIAELVNTISKKIKQSPKPVIMVADGAVAGAAANIAVAVDFVLLVIVLNLSKPLLGLV